MLQQREIAKILSQVVYESGTLKPSGAYSASLLSGKGLPLVTVTSVDLPTLNNLLSPDILRVYSLLAINSFKNNEKCGDTTLDDWTVLSLDETLQAIVKRFVTIDKKNEQSELFVVLFYGNLYKNTQAKAAVDALSNVLSEGLKGYVNV